MAEAVEQAEPKVIKRADSSCGLAFLFFPSKPVAATCFRNTIQQQLGWKRSFNLGSLVKNNEAQM